MQRTTTDTVEVTVISRCGECYGEIMRMKKQYNKQDYELRSRSNPNNFYTEAATLEKYVIVTSLCRECQT